MKLVPLTQRHIEIMAGKDDLPEPHQIIGTACITENGWPVAVGGVRLMGREAEAFAHFRNVTRIYPFALSILSHRFINKLNELGVERVLAYPDPVPNAERFLLWLGFRPTGIVNEKGTQYEKWVSERSSP